MHKAVPGADYYASIENGIFEEAEKYVDRDVIMVSTREGRAETAFNDGTEFPRYCVDETGKRDLSEWTAGRVMNQLALAASKRDLRAEESRAGNIGNALVKTVQKLATLP